MKKTLIVLMGIVILLIPITAMAEEKEESLGEIVVTEERLITPTKQTGETVYTGTEVTKKGMEIQGGKADTSIYEAIDIIPGISLESADPFGLGAEQRVIRVRGVRGYLGSLTVEGVPNYGGNPIGPREYLYDTENMQSISVYKGAVPADLGTSVGSRGGAIELKPRWPEEKFSFDVSQGYGSNDYTRSFLRIDSGKLPKIDTRLSLSYSYTEADKWKGPGDLGPRNNANLALTQPVGEIADVKVWFNYNDLKQDLYRPLDYGQVQSLAENYKLDYNEGRTGVAARDIYYYDYNKGSFRNQDLLALITVRPFEPFRFSLKPYYITEDAEIYQGVTSGGGQIQKRVRDIERTGIIGEAGWDTQAFKAVAGYLFEDTYMNIYTQNYGIAGSALVYRGYGILATGGDSYIHSPYLKIAGTYRGFDWQAGLKYFRLEESASEGYVSSPPTYALVRAPDLDREAKTYDILLPTVGAGYRFTEDLQVYASYGKNFIRPYSYVPLVNLYNTNRATFIANGITLNDLFEGYDMEESDNIDFGVRFKTAHFEIAPTVFYAKHGNLLTTVYDPRVNLSYQQNIGKATGYGLDLETNIYLHKALTLFINPSYTILQYDEDLTYQGRTLEVEGNQVVDTPEWIVKAGLIFSYGGFQVVPMAKYLGKRYGDVEHKEEIDDYFVVDLRINYIKKNFFFVDALRVSLEFNNLFDKEYVAVINASDDTRAGSTSYLVGAPFASLLTVSLEF
jgi:iron complex outermembrane receptor protein